MCVLCTRDIGLRSVVESTGAWWVSLSLGPCLAITIGIWQWLGYWLGQCEMKLPLRLWLWGAGRACLARLSSNTEICSIHRQANDKLVPWQQQKRICNITYFVFFFFGPSNWNVTLLIKANCSATVYNQFNSCQRLKSLVTCGNEQWLTGWLFGWPSN